MIRFNKNVIIKEHSNSNMHANQCIVKAIVIIMHMLQYSVTLPFFIIYIHRMYSIIKFRLLLKKTAQLD